MKKYTMDVKYENLLNVLANLKANKSVRKIQYSFSASTGEYKVDIWYLP